MDELTEFEERVLCHLVAQLAVKDDWRKHFNPNFHSPGRIRRELALEESLATVQRRMAKLYQRGLMTRSHSSGGTPMYQANEETRAALLDQEAARRAAVRVVPGPRRSLSALAA